MHKQQVQPVALFFCDTTGIQFVSMLHLSPDVCALAFTLTPSSVRNHGCINIMQYTKLENLVCLQQSRDENSIALIVCKESLLGGS